MEWECKNLLSRFSLCDRGQKTWGFQDVQGKTGETSAISWLEIIMAAREQNNLQGEWNPSEPNRKRILLSVLSNVDCHQTLPTFRVGLMVNIGPRKSSIGGPSYFSGGSRSRRIDNKDQPQQALGGSLWGWNNSFSTAFLVRPSVSLTHPAIWDLPCDFCIFLGDSWMH